ncbi:hypothetical protein EON64_06020 [archaeon]|nr:MAG: hypothetical protein EON64_06020 [archaeon]
MNKLKKFLKQAARTVLTVVVAVSVFFVVFQVREALLAYSNGQIDESPHVAAAPYQTAVGHFLMFSSASGSDREGFQDRIRTLNREYCFNHNYTWISNAEPRIPSVKQNLSMFSSIKVLDAAAGLVAGSLAHEGKIADWVSALPAYMDYQYGDFEYLMFILCLLFRLPIYPRMPSWLNRNCLCQSSSI